MRRRVRTSHSNSGQLNRRMYSHQFMIESFPWRVDFMPTTFSRTHTRRPQHLIANTTHSSNLKNTFARTSFVYFFKPCPAMVDRAGQPSKYPGGPSGPSAAFSISLHFVCPDAQRCLLHSCHFSANDPSDMTYKGRQGTQKPQSQSQFVLGLVDTTTSL